MVFLSLEGEIYGVFGGTDQSGVENRITKPARVFGMAADELRTRWYRHNDSNLPQWRNQNGGVYTATAGSVFTQTNTQSFA